MEPRIGDKQDLIGTLIIRCGFNPASVIRDFEGGREEQMSFEYYGLKFSRNQECAAASINHSSVSSRTLFYVWRIENGAH